MLLAEWHIHYGLGGLHIFCHCTIRQLQKPFITDSLDHSPLKLARLVWQQAGQWARKLSRCPVWALLPWSNLSLPALHEITSFTLPQSQLAQDLCCQVHQGSTQTLNSLLYLGTCSEPLVQAVLAVPLLVLFIWWHFPASVANEWEMFQPFHNTGLNFVLHLT